MRKPSRKKHFGKHIACQLYYQNPITILREAYRRSINCSETLEPVPDTNRLITHRCRCRWCPTCASIQTAQLIAGYAPQLNELHDLWFVTLTRPTVDALNLKKQIATFQKRWRALTSDRFWKKNKPKGLRKMECTIRPGGQYHYHFHIIVDGEANARWIQRKWLELNPDSSELAQDVRPVKKGQYIELFKYFTKLLVKDKATGKRSIDFVRLNIVFVAIRGKRIYQPFGGLTKVDEDIDDERLIGAEVPPEYYRLWRWMNYQGYTDPETGERLTGDWKLPEWVQELTGEIDESKAYK